jgi:hypothetical protein
MNFSATDSAKPDAMQSIATGVAATCLAVRGAKRARFILPW